MREQRLNFDDYSTDEQERDANKKERAKYLNAYVMRVNGEWGAILPHKRHNIIITADKGVELADFVKEVKAEFEELGLKIRFHCVQNFGIENEIAKFQHKFVKER